MQNSRVENKRSSSLLGMYLTPGRRGEGIAKFCVAAWIWFCLEASAVPETGMIQKPLLALILQHTFGFVPRRGGGGVEVELCRDPNEATAVVLYSPTGRYLEGVFRPWELEHQNIKIVSEPPTIRGRAVRIGSKFSPPGDFTYLGGFCRDVLGEGGLTCSLTKAEIQSVWLGSERAATEKTEDTAVSIA
jgi:hypothetical protein